MESMNNPAKIFLGGIGSLTLLLTLFPSSKDLRNSKAHNEMLFYCNEAKLGDVELIKKVQTANTPLVISSYHLEQKKNQEKMAKIYLFVPSPDQVLESSVDAVHSDYSGASYYFMPIKRPGSTLVNKISCSYYSGVTRPFIDDLSFAIEIGKSKKGNEGIKKTLEDKLNKLTEKEFSDGEQKMAHNAKIYEQLGKPVGFAFFEGKWFRFNSANELQNFLSHSYRS